MIETGYFAKIKDYPEDDVLICVSLKYPWFIDRLLMVHLHEVTPSKILLDTWKQELCDWEEYEKMYRLEMNNSFSQKAIRSLRRDDMTYRLMCWEKEPPCHRFILEDIIDWGAVSE